MDNKNDRLGWRVISVLLCLLVGEVAQDTPTCRLRIAYISIQPQTIVQSYVKYEEYTIL